MDFEARIKELERELLEKNDQIRDILHRTKNDYTMIAGVLGIESSNLEDESSAAVLRDCASRLCVMADMNQALYVKGNDLVDMTYYLYNIASSRISSSVKNQKINVKYDIDDVQMAPKTAQYCGLALNEILTNTIKHAFKDNPYSDDNSISITLKYIDHEKIRFEVSDNGSGIPENLEKKKYSIGQTLLESFAKSVEGKFDMESTPETGTAYRIEFYNPKVPK